MALSRRELILLTNANFEALSLLSLLGINNPFEGKIIFCPFHEDVNKKSAKIHKDSIYCYAERRAYKAYDILHFIGYSDADIELSLSQNPNLLQPVQFYKIDILTEVVRQSTHNFMCGRISLTDHVSKVLTLMLEVLNADRPNKSSL